jgi:hypothetical protein
MAVSRKIQSTNEGSKSPRDVQCWMKNAISPIFAEIEENNPATKLGDSAMEQTVSSSVLF